MFSESLLSSMMRDSTVEEDSTDTDSEITEGPVDIVFTSHLNSPRNVEVLEMTRDASGGSDQFEVVVIEDEEDSEEELLDVEDETDPNVLLAVMDSLNTPLADKYQSIFYDNINDIQEVCEADYTTHCNDQGDMAVTAMSNMMSFMRESMPLFINRRLESKTENHAVKSLEHMADWMASMPHRMLSAPQGRVNKGPAVMPSYMKKHMYRKAKKERSIALEKVTDTLKTPKTTRKLLGDAFNHREHAEHGATPVRDHPKPPLFGKPLPRGGPAPEKGGPPREGGPKKKPTPFFGKPPPKGKPGPGVRGGPLAHDGEDSDSDSDSDDDGDFDSEDERCVHKLIMQYQGEDHVFEGHLGYGEAGDQCLYGKYNQLSTPCRQSIQTLFETRDDYWTNQQSITKNGHNEGNPGFLILMLLLSFFMFLTVRHHGKMKNIRKVLDVIDANPALKEQVESAAGVKIPAHGEGARTCSSYLCSAVKIILMFVGLLFLSFFMAFSSIVFAIWICMALGHEDEHGDMHYPSEFTGKCIWVAVLTLEVIAVVRFIRFLKKKCRGNRDADPQQGNGDANMPPPNLYSNGPPIGLNRPPSQSNNGNGNNGDGNNDTRSFYDYLPVFMRPESPVHDVYIPLSGEESSHGMIRATPAQEMTSIHSTTTSTSISTPTQQATAPAPQFFDSNQRRTVYPGVVQGPIGQVRMV